MRKTLLVLTIVISAGSVTGFEASLQQANGTSENLVYDITGNFSGFYSDFPEGFEGRSEIGSFSFRDQSLENPDYFLNISGREENIENRTVQLYYASRTGNTTIPLMEQPVYTGNISNSSGVFDVDISSFNSIYPGRIYIGFTKQRIESENSLNQTNTSNISTEIEEGVFNLTLINSTFMDGNFSVIPSVRRVQGSTVLEVDEVLRADDDTSIFSSSKDRDLILSVERNGSIVEEASSGVGSRIVFNISFSGGEVVYVNGIAALKTRGVSRCDTIRDNDFYYIINQSSFNTNSSTDGSCLEVEGVNDTVIDFANTTIDGSTSDNQSFAEGCAVRIRNSSGVELKDPRVQQFETGICLSDSKDTLIQGRSSRQNNLGIYLDNSSADINRISLKNTGSEIKAVNTSTANMTKVDFDTADITGVGKDVQLKNVYNPPPDPGNAVNASQWINVSETDASGRIVDLGFNYPPLSETDINPLFMYKFDYAGTSQVNNTSTRQWEFTNLSIVKRPAERIIEKSGEINEFSIFGIYGERIEGNGTGNSPGEGAGNNPGGTGNQGGSQAPGSGAATGGSGGGLQPEPQPEPTPIELDLALESDSVSVQQGGTVPLNFSVTNTGEVDAPGVFVRSNVRAGWESGRQDFRSIPQGETVSGTILIDVFQSEVTGNYTVPVNALRDSSTLDTENLEVEVLPRQRLRDVNVVESPTFLNLETGDSEEIGFLLENSGDYNLKNLTLNIRNAEECIRNVEGSHDLQISERRNTRYTVQTRSSEATCTGVFTFSSDESGQMAVNPVRISVETPSLVERLTTNVLPAILLIWTLFTVYWIRRRFNER